jgi:hypothetical protein
MALGEFKSYPSFGLWNEEDGLSSGMERSDPQRSQGSRGPLSYWVARRAFSNSSPFFQVIWED